MAGMGSLHVCHVDECGEIFDSSKDLNTHKSKVHGKKRFYCTICNRGFSRCYDLIKDHMPRAHPGVTTKKIKIVTLNSEEDLKLRGKVCEKVEEKKKEKKREEEEKRRAEEEDKRAKKVEEKKEKRRAEEEDKRAKKVEEKKKEKRGEEEDKRAKKVVEKERKKRGHERTVKENEGKTTKEFKRPNVNNRLTTDEKRRKVQDVMDIFKDKTDLDGYTIPKKNGPTTEESLDRELQGSVDAPLYQDLGTDTRTVTLMDVTDEPGLADEPELTDEPGLKEQPTLIVTLVTDQTKETDGLVPELMDKSDEREHTEDLVTDNEVPEVTDQTKETEPTTEQQTDGLVPELMDKTNEPEHTEDLVTDNEVPEVTDNEDNEVPEVTDCTDEPKAATEQQTTNEPVPVEQRTDTQTHERTAELTNEQGHNTTTRKVQVDKTDETHSYTYTIDTFDRTTGNSTRRTVTEVHAGHQNDCNMKPYCGSRIGAFLEATYKV